MARNVEIKARIESVEALWPRVVAIADSGPTGIWLSRREGRRWERRRQLRLSRMSRLVWPTM